MTFAILSTSLKQDEDGIWISNLGYDIRYPGDGNLLCFEVEENSFWFRHRNNCIVSILNLFPPDGPILDIGGGNGFVAQRLLAEGLPTSVLEPGRIGVINAKKIRKIPEVIQSTFEEAHFQVTSLDAVGLFDVLEHIDNDKEFLHKIWVALKPKGKIYITVPANQFLWSASDVYAEHYRRYNRKMIKTLVEDYFTIKYFTYFNNVLFIPFFIVRVIPYILFYKRKRIGMTNPKEHGSGGGFIINLLSKMLDNEMNKIRHGKHINFGTSCLLVLEKKLDENPL